VGDRPAAPRARVDFEYRVDRLLATKLEHVYQLLVPDQRWPVGGAGAPAAEEKVNEPTCRDVRARVV